jgi:hypothetical protein
MGRGGRVRATAARAPPPAPCALAAPHSSPTAAAPPVHGRRWRPRSTDPRAVAAHEEAARPRTAREGACHPPAPWERRGRGGRSRRDGRHPPAGPPRAGGGREARADAHAAELPAQAAGAHCAAHAGGWGSDATRPHGGRPAPLRLQRAAARGRAAHWRPCLAQTTQIRFPRPTIPPGTVIPRSAPASAPSAYVLGARRGARRPAAHKSGLFCLISASRAE